MYIYDVTAPTGSSERLRRLLGRDIIVPAKTVGLSDSDQSIKGKVVEANQEENSLWCTVSGDKRWYDMLQHWSRYSPKLSFLPRQLFILTNCRYCWHVDEVRSWLVSLPERPAKAASMPVIAEHRATKQTSKSLLQSPSGRPQRPQTAGELP